MRQIAIFGLGSFGSAIAKSLAKGGAEVIAVDKDNVIQQMKKP